MDAVDGWVPQHSGMQPAIQVEIVIVTENISIALNVAQKLAMWNLSLVSNIWNWIYRLTTGRNEKVHSLHDPAIKFYGVEAVVVLKSAVYTLKITIFVKMWNLGQFGKLVILKIWYFVNKCFN